MRSSSYTTSSSTAFRHVVCQRVLGQYHNPGRRRSTGRATPDTAFFDFIAWERAYLKQRAGRRRPGLVEKPVDRNIGDHRPALRCPAQPGLPGEGIGCETLTLDIATLDTLKYIGSMLNQNLSALLLGVFNILIHQLSAEDDIAVNMPVAGRPMQRHENTIGCYIN